MNRLTDHIAADRLSTAAIGGALVLLGAVLLGVEFIGLEAGEAWPVFVIAPGLGLVFAGLVGVRARWMVVAGTIVTLVGLLLLYQQRTDHWESWAYAWALVGLGGAGLGIAVAGLVHGDADGVRRGVQYMLSGGALFALGLLYFEGTIGIGDERAPFPEWTLAAVIIAVGLALVGWALLRRKAAPASQPVHSDVEN
jgi:hypothetical protein